MDTTLQPAENGNSADPELLKKVLQESGSPVASDGQNLENESLHSDLQPSSGDLYTNLHKFADSPDYDNFLSVSRRLLHIGDFPEALKKAVETSLFRSRIPEEREMFSEIFNSYELVSSHLPEVDRASSWSRNRASQTELYHMLGTVCAIVQITEIDHMLVQSLLSSDYRTETESGKENLKKRLALAYKSLFTKESPYITVLNHERDDINPLAVSKFLKGFLAPYLELEHGKKIGFFEKIGYALDDEPVPATLEHLQDSGLTPENAKFLRKLGAQTKKEPEHQPEGERLLLSQIKVSNVIDETFVKAVLTAKASDKDKLLYLNGAILAVERVKDTGLYALTESIPRGVKLVADGRISGMKEVTSLLSKYGVGNWDPGAEEAYDIPILMIALKKTESVSNKGYLNIAKSQLVEAVQQSVKWSKYKDTFRSDILTLIDKISEELRGK